MEDALPEQFVRQTGMAGANPQIDGGHGGKQNQRKAEIFETAVEFGADFDEGKEQSGSEEEGADDLQEYDHQYCRFIECFTDS